MTSTETNINHEITEAEDLAKKAADVVMAAFPETSTMTSYALVYFLHQITQEIIEKGKGPW